MVFRIITIASLLVLIGILTYPKFRRKSSPARKPFFGEAFAYFTWLGRSTAELTGPTGRPLLRQLFSTWLSRYPAPWLRWAFIGLISSFAYLAVSGFAFALFSSRGIFGLPLVFHVVGGGIFAVCLAVIVVFRAKEYVAFPASFDVHFSSLTSFLAHFPPVFLRSLLFWIFSVSGLLVTATALLSMLPYFTFHAQGGFIDVHRYSALTALLAAIAFVDKGLPQQGT